MSMRTFSNQSIALLIPDRPDGILTFKALAKMQTFSVRCASLEELYETVDHRTGVLVASAEMLNTSDITQLGKWLAEEPLWSNLPLILLSEEGWSDPKIGAVTRILGPFHELTVLKCPVGLDALLPMVRSALRLRRKHRAGDAHLAQGNKGNGHLERTLEQKAAGPDNEQENLEIREQERRHIGRELHDEIGGLLTGTAMMAQNVANQLQEQGIEVAEEVVGIARYVREANTFVHNLSRGLIPLELEENRLPSALRQLTLRAEKLYDINCHLAIEDPLPYHDSQTATNLYRIAQEAINNAVKHGKATAVSVILTADNRQFQLCVEDNGCGISVEIDDPEQMGAGLPAMKHRARKMGGALEIKRHSGGGTLLICTARVVDCQA